MQRITTRFTSLTGCAKIATNSTQNSIYYNITFIYKCVLLYRLYLLLLILYDLYLRVYYRIALGDSEFIVCVCVCVCVTSVHSERRASTVTAEFSHIRNCLARLCGSSEYLAVMRTCGDNNRVKINARKR